MHQGTNKIRTWSNEIKVKKITAIKISSPGIKIDNTNKASNTSNEWSYIGIEMQSKLKLPAEGSMTRRERQNCRRGRLRKWVAAWTKREEPAWRTSEDQFTAICEVQWLSTSRLRRRRPYLRLDTHVSLWISVGQILSIKFFHPLALKGRTYDHVFELENSSLYMFPFCN